MTRSRSATGLGGNLDATSHQGGPRMSTHHGADDVDQVVSLTDEQIRNVRTVFAIQACTVALTAEAKGRAKAFAELEALKPLATYGRLGEPIDDEMRDQLSAEEIRAIRAAAVQVVQWAVLTRNHFGPNSRRYYDSVYRIADDLVVMTGGDNKLD